MGLILCNIVTKLQNHYACKKKNSIPTFRTKNTSTFTKFSGFCNCSWNKNVVTQKSTIKILNYISIKKSLESSGLKTKIQE